METTSRDPLVARLLLFILITTSSSRSVTGLFVDYSENAELIQQRAGFDIRLQCGLKGLIDERRLADVIIHWFFKQCNDSQNCFDFHDNDWTQLPCEDTFCKPDLLLRNVSEKYSGLYKCTIYPYRLDADHSLDIQLVRTYQLDVKNTSVAAVPEFLDSYPLNKTAVVGSTVVFQCRIHSEIHPTIKWFRRIGLDEDSATHPSTQHIVKYKGGRNYELLTSAREKVIGDNIYLSKLILGGVGAQQSGYYACVAISYRGHRIREAYLQVVVDADVDYLTEYAEPGDLPTDPSEFWLLFLMPLGLAMLPLTVYVCYAIFKRCRRNATVQWIEHHRIVTC